jgi:hypothetical protein
MQHYVSTGKIFYDHPYKCDPELTLVPPDAHFWTWPVNRSSIQHTTDDLSPFLGEEALLDEHPTISSNEATTSSASFNAENHEGVTEADDARYAYFDNQTCM